MWNILFCPPRSHLVSWGVLSVLSTAAFIRSYDGEFVFDDSEAILNNKDIQPESDWSNLLRNDFWGSNISSTRSHKSYRPLTVLTFRLNYVASGGFHAVGFHVVSLALYTTVCLLLYHVLCYLLQSCQIPRSVPWLATVLFAAHPIHTEAVCGIVGRAELLCGCFYLIALKVHISICRAKSFSAELVLLWAVYLLSCVASILSKEQGITVLGVCSAWDVLLHQKWEHGVFHELRYKLPKSQGFLQRHAVLFVSGVVILSARWWVMGGSGPTFQPVDNPHSFVNGTLLRLLNYQYLYAINGWLCVCPVWLCFDWSMGCVPVVSSYADPRLLAPLLFWTVIVTVLLRCCHHISTDFNRCVLFSLALVLVPFLPASNLLFPVGFVIAERVLFLPSIGVCLLLSATVCRIYHLLPKLQSFISCAMYILLALYTVKSMTRSEQWRNEMSLFESAQSVCPLNAKVHYNIAKVHADRGNTQRALDEYRLAIQLHAEYDQALNNLGNLLKDLKQLHEAEVMLERATQIRGEFAAAWMNLGIVQAELKKTSLAEQSYLTALTHRRQYPDCLYNLGNLYLESLRHSEALQAWRNATLQKPAHISAWVNMILLLDSLGRFDEMSIVSEEAVRLNPDDATLHYNYANGLGKAGLHEKSEKHYLRALQLKPDTAVFYSNLGVLYHRWKKYADAERSYKRALVLDPGNANTENNLRMLLRILTKETS